MEAYYRFLDITAQIHSQDKQFINFVNSYLSGFPISDSNYLDKFIINSCFKPSCKASPLPNSQISQNIYLDEGKVVWFNNEITVSIRKTGTEQMFQIEVYPNNSRKTKAMQILWPSRYSKEHQFQTALRSMFHFPLFWILERYHNIHLLHGSALAKNDVGILLCGLAGVGKSTLSLELVLNKEYKHITDNYIIFDSSKVYGFPEPVRIDRKATQLISSEVISETSFKVGRRSYFVLPTYLTMPEAKVKKIFFNMLSPRSRVYKIDSNIAFNIVLGINSYIREFHDSSGFIGFNWDAQAITSVPYEKTASIKNMLSKSECFILEVGKDNPRETAEIIDDAIEHS